MSAEKTGFHDGLVTVSQENWFEVHSENYQLRQRNLELQTALDSIKAIDETIATRDAKKYNLAYIVGILKNWGSRGWTTPEMVEKAKQEYLASQQVPDGEVTDDFLAAINIFKEDAP